MLRAFLVALVVITAACGDDADPYTRYEDPTARARTLRWTGPVAEVDARFVSVAIDTAQIVGAPWWDPSGDTEVAGGTRPYPPVDLDAPRLRTLARALAPGLLRIGGSEADKVYYDLSAAPGPAPQGYGSVLTAARWADIAEFSTAVGFDLFFTLNAGPGPRNADQVWTATQSAALVRHAVERGDPVYAWELGNEINAFQVIHGLDFRIDAPTYAADVARARRMLDSAAPGLRLAGPSSAFWPELGEFNPILPDFMARAGDQLDIITWHYYPLQSRRCALAVRRADADRAVDPEVLEEVDRWAAQVEQLRDAHAEGRPIWLGETGHAQCGGEPALSDTYRAGFWWLDQLGRIARRGQPITVRQTLLGSDYGLIDDATLEPRPDYWSAVLWQRSMGPRVLSAELTPLDARLTVYAHCHPDTPNALTLVAVNPSPRGAFLRLDPAAPTVRAFRLTGDPNDPSGVRLNGRRLRVDADGALPALEGVIERLDPARPEVWVPGESYGFYVLEATASCF